LFSIRVFPLHIDSAMFSFAFYLTAGIFVAHSSAFVPSLSRGVSGVKFPLHMVAGSSNDEESRNFVQKLIDTQEYGTAFTYLNRYDNIRLDPSQRNTLLNKVVNLLDVGESPGRFYNFLKKTGHIASFGSLNGNYPILDASLTDFEKVMMNSPEQLHAVTGLDREAFTFIDKSADIADTSAKFADSRMVAGLIALMGGSAAQLGGMEPLEASALVTALLGGMFIADSPLVLKGALSRFVSWGKEATANKISPESREVNIRRQAATFLMAYLVGTPIVDVEIFPENERTRRLFRTPEAPRVDMRDDASLAMEGIGSLDLGGIKRLAVAYMAAPALDAVDTGKTEPAMNDYVRMFFAILFQKTLDPAVCQISPSALPVRMLPVLSLWGFSQAVLVLREQKAALDAVSAVFREGGGVGDAIEAIEANVELASIRAREESRMARQGKRVTASASPVTSINLILHARSLPDEAIEIEIEAIPGTSTTFTEEELVLPLNPTVADIRELTKQVMNGKMQRDIAQKGGVSPETRKEVRELSERVTEALMIAAEREKANTDPQKYSAAWQAVLQEHGVLESQLPEALVSAVKAGVPVEYLLPAWMSYFSAAKIGENVKFSVGQMWVELGRPLKEVVTGENIDKAVDQAWCSLTPPNAGNKDVDPQLEGLEIDANEARRLTSNRDLFELVQSRVADGAQLPPTAGMTMPAAPTGGEDAFTFMAAIGALELISQGTGFQDADLDQQMAEKEARIAELASRSVAIEEEVVETTKDSSGIEKKIVDCLKY
jgi:hypothetical protein